VAGVSLLTLYASVACFLQAMVIQNLRPKIPEGGLQPSMSACQRYSVFALSPVACCNRAEHVECVRGLVLAVHVHMLQDCKP
jgi:hypothetical protein